MHSNYVVCIQANQEGLQTHTYIHYNVQALILINMSYNKEYANCYEKMVPRQLHSY